MTFTVRGTVVRRVAPRAIAYAALGALAALALNEGVNVAIGPVAHSLLGIALGMLLVFRTNAAYDRYWEGRRRWSEIVASARNLVRAGACYVGADPRLTALVTTYVATLRDQLRGRRDARAARKDLSDDDAHALGTEAATPLAVAARMSARIRDHLVAGEVSPDIGRAMEGYVAQLIEHQSACERIVGTPMPFAYTAQIRHLLVVYLVTLPFALVGDLGWMVVPAMAVIAFGLIGIEEAGIEIEEPFGEDENDLALDAFCDTVRRDAKLLTDVGAAPPAPLRRGARASTLPTATWG